MSRALAAYSRFLETPWIWCFETDAPKLGWSLLRAGELYEERHQPLDEGVFLRPSRFLAARGPD